MDRAPGEPESVIAGAPCGRVEGVRRGDIFVFKGIPYAKLVGPEHGEDRLFDLAAAAEEMLGGFTPSPL